MWEFVLFHFFWTAAKGTQHKFWSVLLPTAVQGSDWRCRAGNGHLINQHLPILPQTSGLNSNTQIQDTRRRTQWRLSHILQHILYVSYSCKTEMFWEQAGPDKNLLRLTCMFILHCLLPFCQCWSVRTLVHKTAPLRKSSAGCLHCSISQNGCTGE